MVDEQFEEPDTEAPTVIPEDPEYAPDPDKDELLEEDEEDDDEDDYEDEDEPVEEDEKDSLDE